MQEFQLEHEGEKYKAKYYIDDEDILVAFLPDGSKRETVLDGLNPISAVRVHLKSYAIDCHKKNNYNNDQLGLEKYKKMWVCIIIKLTIKN